MSEADESKELSRRSFLTATIASVAVIVTAGIAVPAMIYVVGPALQRSQEEEWVRLGSKSKVEVGVPTLFKVSITRQTGWITTEEEISVYVVTQDGREYLALSNICTHLGCRVRWISDQDIFFCPCHNGVFSETGAVISGPPPAPLERYELKVEGDQLFIKVS